MNRGAVERDTPCGYVVFKDGSTPSRLLGSGSSGLGNVFTRKVIGLRTSSALALNDQRQEGIWLLAGMREGRKHGDPTANGKNHWGIWV